MLIMAAKRTSSVRVPSKKVSIEKAELMRGIRRGLSVTVAVRTRSLDKSREDVVVMGEWALQGYFRMNMRGIVFCRTGKNRGKIIRAGRRIDGRVTSP